MEYSKLGNTGLEVSKICLGGMSFGDPSKWIHSWVLDQAETKTILRKALDAGINFFDTANVYSLGTSEEYMGKVLKQSARRDEIVLATKVHGQMFEGPNGGGLSRKHIISQVDQSLQRLGMDYIDLLYIHRWDNQTPIEETMSALNDLVRQGKVLYLGASSMHAWQFQKAQYVADKHGWTPFSVMQNHYNLLYREEEREMIPLCQDMGVGLVPYSPLAAGRLVRDGELYRDDVNKISFILDTYQDHLDSKLAFPLRTIWIQNLPFRISRLVPGEDAEKQRSLVIWE